MREPRVISRPEPGYWAIVLVKGGPTVAARIFIHQTAHEPGEPENLMERSPLLSAEINGEPVAVDEVWLRRGRPITKAEHDFLVADRAWVREHAAHLPEARPTEKVDRSTIPLPF